MNHTSLRTLAARRLDDICRLFPHRSTGSEINRQAAAYLARAVPLGFRVETPEFECLDWADGGASLQAGGLLFPLFTSPYSLSASAGSSLASASDLPELQALEAAGKILLLHGELASQQLMPKNFPFFQDEAQQRLIALLEEKAPAALVTACQPGSSLAGGLYPWPVFEDGDFNIPSAYLDAEAGKHLAALVGQPAVIDIHSRRIPAHTANVVAKIGPYSGPHLLFCAHFDSKPTTPGALDNAAGVVTLLMLAELLRDYQGPLGIELVFFNGEDHYSAAGQVNYLAQNGARLHDQRLVVNLDGLGYLEGETAYSLYNLAPEQEDAARRTFAAFPGLAEGQPWYQGDHTMFVMQGKPAIAYTSQAAWQSAAALIHTGQDTPQIVDPARLAAAAQALRELVKVLPAG